mmetsp:Transcript_64090/g.133637  ORF Transcript_64090/g.133637 Transcript_64090/m.133637 type:complete len:274 (-) Transcript_64090:5235-6056(-)
MPTCRIFSPVLLMLLPLPLLGPSRTSRNTNLPTVSPTLSGDKIHCTRALDASSCSIRELSVPSRLFNSALLSASDMLSPALKCCTSTSIAGTEGNTVSSAATAQLSGTRSTANHRRCLLLSHLRFASTTTLSKDPLTSTTVAVCQLARPPRPNRTHTESPNLNLLLPFPAAMPVAPCAAGAACAEVRTHFSIARTHSSWLCHTASSNARPTCGSAPYSRSTSHAGLASPLTPRLSSTAYDSAEHPALSTTSMASRDQSKRRSRASEFCVRTAW